MYLLFSTLTYRFESRRKVMSPTNLIRVLVDTW